MLNIFKRKKNDKSREPESLPIEEEISAIIDKHAGLRLNHRTSDFMHFSKTVKEYDKGEIYSICSSSDLYPLSIIIKEPLLNKMAFIKEINELTTMEVLQYSYNREFYEELLWSTGDTDLYTNENNDYFISIRDFNKDMIHNNYIEISHSREFLFGNLLIGNLSINGSPVAVSYNKILFSEENPEKGDYSQFQSNLLIDGREIQIHFLFKVNDRISSVLAKETIKNQKINLENALGKSVKIKSAGVTGKNQSESFSGYSLVGHFHTTGADIPFIILFPRKLINLFPEYVCSTIKGKILQINKELFRKDFPTFYKPMNHFLLADFLSVAGERDLNLICQNFFVANSIHGDDIRKLFFYKVKFEEKSKVLREPFISAQTFLNHLPLRIKEEFQISKSYSQTHQELLLENQLILDRIYKQIKEGNLLLTYKSQSILQKECGSREKESKTLRLRKLISDKRYINYLEKMDGKKVQVMLSTMKNFLIVDTFIYQTDELIKLKPFLSRIRFSELKEDISYTQNKIKSNQIDMDRICDSIEKFNRFIGDFVEKDRLKEA